MEARTVPNIYKIDLFLQRGDLRLSYWWKTSYVQFWVNILFPILRLFVISFQFFLLFLKLEMQRFFRIGEGYIIQEEPSKWALLTFDIEENLICNTFTLVFSIFI